MHAGTCLCSCRCKSLSACQPANPATEISIEQQQQGAFHVNIGVAWFGITSRFTVRRLLSAYIIKKRNDKRAPSSTNHHSSPSSGQFVLWYREDGVWMQWLLRICFYCSLVLYILPRSSCCTRDRGGDPKGLGRQLIWRHLTDTSLPRYWRTIALPKRGM